MSDNIDTPGGLEAALKKALDVMQNDWPANQPNVIVDGVPIAIATFTASLQGSLDDHKAEQDTKAAHDKALLKRGKSDASVKKLLVGLHAMAKVVFGVSSPVLGKLGKKVKAKAKPTAATKAKAVAQAQQTKKARGEIGTKARSKIKAPASPPKV